MSVKEAYLGSEISAACLTLPQYVLRSCLDVGRSRLPDIEADMVVARSEDCAMRKREKQWREQLHK